MTGSHGRRPVIRRRFWWEAALATLTGLLLVLTLITPQWIEVLFDVDPDGGSGALEWAVVGALAAVAAGLSLTAWLEWRRAGPRRACLGADHDRTAASPEAGRFLRRGRVPRVQRHRQRHGTAGPCRQRLRLRAPGR